jgi:hypothetical protein
VQKEYDHNNDKMAEYLAEEQRMEKFFDGFEVQYVPRLDNHDVDHLALIASSRAPTPPYVIVVKLSKPSVKPVESINEADLMVIDGSDQELALDWMNLIRMCLINQPLLDDNAKVELIVCKAKIYHLINGVLYQQGANGMMMWCISREECIQLIWDIHSGVCGSHSSWHSIIDNAFRHGFYWPTAMDDVIQVITKCNDGQFFQKQTTKHANPLHDQLISSSPLQYGKSTLWVYCPGHQEDSDSCSSQSTHSPNRWKLCQK